MPSVPPYMIGDPTPAPGRDAVRWKMLPETMKTPAPGRPHVLLDPDLATRPNDQTRPRPNMSVPAMADSIVDALAKGTGPILICMPGLDGSGYQTAILNTAKSFIEQAGPQSVSITHLQYPNSMVDAIKRMLTGGTWGEEDILTAVLDRLKKRAPGRPVLIVAESFGAWLATDALRRRPDLAAIVQRVATFARQMFVELPTSIGSARHGAHLLPAAGRDRTGFLEFRHTNDFFPYAGKRMTPAHVIGMIKPTIGQQISGAFVYHPHYYEQHGEEAARWLMQGELPASNPEHVAEVRER